MAKITFPKLWFNFPLIKILTWLKFSIDIPTIRLADLTVPDALVQFSSFAVSILIFPAAMGLFLYSSKQERNPVPTPRDEAVLKVRACVLVLWTSF